jgi:DNA anti-recombination protein RmuC
LLHINLCFKEKNHSESLITKRKNSKMENFQEKFLELESTFKSFINSYSERMTKTEEKLETICSRIDRLESLSSENRREFSEKEVTTSPVDKDVGSRKKEVKLIFI